MTNLSNKTATSVRYDDHGATVCRYHQTDIVKIKDGAVTLNSGGWRTVTTKRRMNQCFEEWGLPFYLYQEKGEWKVSGNGKNKGLFDFSDNMTLEC